MRIRCEDLLEAVLEAGRVIMEIYAANGAVDSKADGSPVTEADRRGEAVILRHLGERFPDIPVIAEEAVAAGRVPQTPDGFFLVDPLDGTKEFVSRKGEFTVNIAFVRDGAPVCGVVYAPAKGALYAGDVGEGAWMARIDDPLAPVIGARSAIRARAPGTSLVAVGSRSHGSAETDRYLERFTIARFEPRGSSLKFCSVAAGEADIYPRFGRTMEWDTAAGHAVLLAAGGSVLTPDGKPLAYNKRGQADDADFANPHFIAYADPALAAVGP